MMADLNYPAIGSFTLFIIATLFVTAYAARRTRSRKDFYVAGNTIGGLQNGIAISGDYMSAASFLGMVGLLFIGGFDTIYFVINLILSWAVVLFLIAEKAAQPGLLHLCRRGLRAPGGAAGADTGRYRDPGHCRALPAGTDGRRRDPGGIPVRPQLYPGRTDSGCTDDDICDFRRHDRDHLGTDHQGRIAGRRRHHTLRRPYW